MDIKKNTTEDSLEAAVKGAAVSRRWLLKNTATAAAGTIAVSAMGAGVAPAETKPATAVVAARSLEHDPHSGKAAELNPTQFHGWETF